MESGSYMPDFKDKGFLISNKGKKTEITIELDLQKKLLVFIEEKDQSLLLESLNLDDIIGANVDQASASQSESKLSLRIFFFPKVLFGWFKKKQRRVFKEIEVFHQDKSILLRWVTVLRTISKMRPEEYDKIPQGLPESEVEELKLLVFISPKSGKGLAQKLWNTCSPLLGFKMDVIVTAHRKHAYEVVSTLEIEKLKQYSGIITIGGDGIPHEVLNGLFQRSDYELIKNIPLGTLPGGSGNALFNNVCKFSGETPDTMSGLYIIMKNRLKSIDITKCETNFGSCIYSFLGLEWALISDIDSESEKFRFLGGFRFELLGAWRGVFLRRYRGRISFTNKEDINYRTMPAVDKPLGPEFQVQEKSFISVLTGNMPLLSQTNNFFPFAKLDDGFIDLQILPGEASRVEAAKFLLNLGESGNIVNVREGKPWANSKLEYHKVKAFRIEIQGGRATRIGLDGEFYDAEVVQGVVIPRCLRIFHL